MVIGMKVALAFAVLLGGCGLYFGDDKAPAPDAAVATPDAGQMCGATLPRCGDLGCAVGALPVDCPRSEDPSVCYCHAQAHPGWCFNR